jgi:hypothetical protein
VDEGLTRQPRFGMLLLMRLGGIMMPIGIWSLLLLPLLLLALLPLLKLLLLFVGLVFGVVHTWNSFRLL